MNRKHNHTHDAGFSLNGTGPNIHAAIQAHLSETYYTKPSHLSRSSHGHAQNVREFVSNGDASLEFRHVLIDYTAGNKHLKSKMMTRLDAFKRNEAIRGTGFAWAMCSK